MPHNHTLTAPKEVIIGFIVSRFIEVQVTWKFTREATEKLTIHYWTIRCRNNIKTNQRVPKSKRSGAENIFGTRVNTTVVVWTVSCILQSQIILVEVFLAKNAGKEFPVSDLLDQSSNDFPGLLEQRPGIPVFAYFPKFSCNSVVFTDKH